MVGEQKAKCQEVMDGDAGLWTQARLNESQKRSQLLYCPSSAHRDQFSA